MTGARVARGGDFARECLGLAAGARFAPIAFPAPQMRVWRA